MVNLVPRPIKDVIIGIESIISFNPQRDSILNEIRGEYIMLKAYTMPKKYIETDIASRVSQMMKAVARTALAILGMIGAYKIGGSIFTAAILGGIVSLPAFAIAGGSFLVHHGITNIIASVASGSFSALGYGTLIAGWVVLEKHDIVEMGFVDYIIRSKAKSHVIPLLDVFIAKK